MSTVSARTEAPRQHTPQTYFLAVNDDFELKIAQAWLQQKYPNSAGKVVKELPMHRLPQNAVVIPVTRGEDRSPSWTQAHDRGSVRGIHVAPAELAREVREGKALAVADFWVAQRDEFDAFGGELNRDSFLEKLSAAATPAVARVHIGNPNSVKLSFV
jgi:hypothetical protein